MRTFSQFARPRFRMGLVGLVTLLLVGGLAVGFTLVKSAHAAGTYTVTDCTSANASGATLNLDTALAQAQASPGNLINFSCSGDLVLDQTLNITTTLTIDGTGQTVSLDGNGARQDIFVNSGASLTLNDLTIQGGNGQFGGGIENEGTLSLTNSTVANNKASEQGGGIANGGTMTLICSTVADNSAPDSGGGFDNNGILTLINSTVADNSSPILAGGIANGSNGTLTLINSTVADNSGSAGAGIVNQTIVKISGSIVADNSGGNCANVGGTITDQGYNLESGTDCGFTGTGSLQNTDPLLGPLANNGGPTQTMALLAGSPAIDAGPPAGQCPTTDQRGVSRPDNGEAACDIGAYEYVDPPDADLALTNVPSPIITDATSPAGAVVIYTAPTVQDEDTPLPTVTCDHASGATFPIGSTTVTCTASAPGDANSPASASFTVTVKGASAQVSDLTSLVNSFGLAPDFQASFDTQLQAVQTDLALANTTQACRDLQAVLNHAQAQSGKHLTTAQANQIITAARRIQVVLGC